MNLLENIKMALSSLKSNKMRAILTMLGIIIGISSIIMITTMGNIMEKSITDTINSQGGSNLVGFQLMTKPDAVRTYITSEDFITEDMLENISQRFSDEIKATAITTGSENGKVRHNREDLDLVIYSVNYGYIHTQPYEMIAGRYINEKDVTRKLNTCVISDKQAEKLYGSVKGALGQTISIKMLDGSYDFTVVGVYEYKMTVMMSAMVNMIGEDWNNEVYIPYSTMSKLYNKGETRFYFYYIIVNDGVDPASFCDEVTSYMNNRWYRDNDSIQIMSQTMESQMEMINQVLGIVSLVIAVIAGISLVVGGIGVMNIMLVSVTERTREIGVRKALGAPNSAIRSQFIIESMIICLIGGIIGIIGGILLGNVAGILIGTVAPPSIGAIVLAVSFSMAIGVFFGYYPANRAAKLDPIEALRYE